MTSQDFLFYFNRVHPKQGSKPTEMQELPGVEDLKIGTLLRNENRVFIEKSKGGNRDK